MVRPYVRVVLTGVVARPQSYELVGPLAERTLAGLVTDDHAPAAVLTAFERAGV
jgi:hypothetical protein